MRENKLWLVGGEDIRFRLPLLLALRDEGYTVGAVGTEDGEAFARTAVPYWRYALRSGISPSTDLEAFDRLYRLFLEHRPDIVHAFDTKPGIIAPMAARKAGIPGRVCTITGMGYLFASRSLRARLLRPVYRYLEGLAGKSSGVTVFQNADDRDYFLEKKMVEAGKDRLVRGSGIDVERLLRARPDDGSLDRLREELNLRGRRVVTMVSRLVMQKGVREYLDAARQVCRDRGDVVFLLVGPASSDVRQLISKKSSSGAAGKIRFLGVREDVPALLALTDLFVLPTWYREGIPRVLLEAGAMGLPLITTDMPGCRDVVKDEWNGLLVPQRDALSLAKAILRLVSGTERTVMGERSRRHVRENFDLRRVVRSYCRIYRGLLEGEAVS